MGQLGGTGKNVGKEGKTGIFLQFSGFIGICWTKEEGIPSWDLSTGGNSCPTAQTGSGNTSGWKTLRKIQLMWRKPRGKWKILQEQGLFIGKRENLG